MPSVIRLTIRNIFTAILISGLFVCNSFAGTADSLENIIKNKSLADTTRVQMLMQLAGEYLESNPQLCLKYVQDAHGLAVKSGYDEGIGESTGWLAYLYEQQGEIKKALEYYKESLIIARRVKSRRSEATIYNNIGAIYKDQGLLDSALYYHHLSLKIGLELKDKSAIATSYNNLGLLYFNQGRIPEALNYYFKALDTHEEIKDNDGIATCCNNIASVYRDQKDYDKAFAFYKRSLSITRIAGDKYGAGYSLVGMGMLMDELGKTDSALYYFQESLKLRREISDKQGIAYSLMNIGASQVKKNQNEDAEKSFRESLDLFREIGDQWGQAKVTNKLGKLTFMHGNYAEAENFLKKSLQLASELGYPADISNAAENLQQLYRKQKKWDQALVMNDLFIKMRDSLVNDNNRKATIKTQFQYEYDKKSALLKSEQEKRDAVNRAEVSKQKILRNGFIGGFAALLLFSVIVWRQRNYVKAGKKRSDELLLNILPGETAEELKLTGSAKARAFDQVTVMFTDFRDFTQVSERMPPEELVKLIHDCYSEFDAIIHRYGIEKIKTIGDSYMCAGGLPVPNSTNAVDIVNAALDIRDFMKREHDRRKAEGLPFFEIRIGCHTGNVVAGIVGIRKFAYDIWGDTVNIASRMESAGAAGKVNISSTTYELVKKHFHCNHRGKVEAKHKGEIEMYFVER